MVTTTPAFAGWFRPNGSKTWTRLASAPTHAEAYDLLLAAAVGRSGDLIVLPAGREPANRSMCK
jgi:hypothetical protein